MTSVTMEERQEKINNIIFLYQRRDKIRMEEKRQAEKNRRKAVEASRRKNRRK